MTAGRPRAPRLATLSFLAVALGATTAATSAPLPAPLRNRLSLAQETRSNRVEVAARGVPAAAASKPLGTTVIRDSSSRVSSNDVVAGRQSNLIAGQTTPTLPPLREPLSERAARSGLSIGQSSQSRHSELPVAVIRALIAEHHPEVMDGDTTVDLVMIVVDANNKYVMSGTGRNSQIATSARATTPGADTVASGATASMLRRFVIDGRSYMTLVTGRSPSPNELIEMDDIKSVEVTKYAPGVIRPTRLGVVLIALK